MNSSEAGKLNEVTPIMRWFEYAVSNLLETDHLFEGLKEQIETVGGE